MEVCGTPRSSTRRVRACCPAGSRCWRCTPRRWPSRAPATPAGMNVYVLQSALHLARARASRWRSSPGPPRPPIRPLVRGGPRRAGAQRGGGTVRGSGQIRPAHPAVRVHRRGAARRGNHEPGYYDIVHSHYWLSGQVGWLARDRWAVPLVHTAHTLAAVKNAALADGDAPEPPLRTVGEQQVVDEADRLIVNTEDEARQLVSLHHADPARIDVVHPGVDLDVFRPGDRRGRPGRAGAARWTRRWSPFVGRIQPLKAPDVVAARGGQAAAGCASWWRAARRAAVWPRRTAWCGWPTNWASPTRVTFLPPQSREQPGQRVTRPPIWWRCRAIRSRSGWSRSRRRPAAHRWWRPRSAGCRWRCATGSPARWSPGTTPHQWADAIDELLRLARPRRRDEPRGRRACGRQFSWDNTVDALLASYGRAIARLTAERAAPAPRPDRAPAQAGRRWTPRRGVRRMSPTRAAGDRGRRCEPAADLLGTRGRARRTARADRGAARRTQAQDQHDPEHRRAFRAGRGVRLPQARREPRGRLPLPAQAQPPALRRGLHPGQRRRHLPGRPDVAGRRSTPTRSTGCSGRCSKRSTPTSTRCWSWVFGRRSRRNGRGGCRAASR